MNLNSGLPFWLIKYGLPYEYPKLEKDIKTDVLIIGGGITGALVAHFLGKADISCLLVDKRSIGLGSTCASTSLIQYELDVPLSQLSDKIGNDQANSAYLLCNEAINQLAEVCRDIDFDDFHFKKSVYYAAARKDISLLKKEYTRRKQIGLEVAYLDKRELRKEFGIQAPGAILSGKAAVTDAYLLANSLLQYNIQKGLSVYDRTEITRTKHERNGVKAFTKNGYSIKAAKIIYAVGYEAATYLPSRCIRLYTTYATISESMHTNNRFHQNDILMWNTGDPYLYVRPVGNRIIIGGKDVKFSTSSLQEKVVYKRGQELGKDFQHLFPDINFLPEFSWAGTFGVTKDSLPFIGAYKKIPNSYFALGYGGNGITFSLIAARLLCNLLQGKGNPHAGLFSFDRI